jgi:Potential Queuosine, Q, salvage protein family
MHIFRSDTEEQMPMVKERIRVMREDGGALLKVSAISVRIGFIHMCELRIPDETVL